MPKARRCGAIDSPVSAMMMPAGAAPNRPNIRLSTIAQSVWRSSSSEPTPTTTLA